MTYVLGIDGGGTKTTGIIANHEGETIVEATVGASNPNIVNRDLLLKEFSTLAERLNEKNGEAFQKISRIFAGVSGTDHPCARQTIVDTLTEVMPSTASTTVDNDAIIALYSGTMGKPGIVQISGTGSITYGINEQGERSRVGGWGHFIDERGSGYGLGHDALHATFLEFDKMGPPTKLTELLLEHFNEKRMDNIIPSIYNADNPKETVASLGRLVMHATDYGDEVAKNIIKKNGRYIGKCIKTLINILFKESEMFYGVAVDQESKRKKGTIPIVLAGGLFNRLDLIQNSIAKELDNQSHPVTLIKPNTPPVYGAVLAALMQSEQQNKKKI